MTTEITQPYRVTISPHGLGSTDFGSLFPQATTPILRVDVEGGKSWIPVWDKTSVVYDKPDRATVYLRGIDRPQVFNGPKYGGGVIDGVTVYGGKHPMRKPPRASALLGADSYLEGIDLQIGIGEYDYAVLGDAIDEALGVQIIPKVAPSAAVRPSSNSDPAIWGIQGELQTRGYDPGPQDGVLGPKTIAAMNQYRTWAAANDPSYLDAAQTNLLKRIEDVLHTAPSPARAPSAPSPPTPSGPVQFPQFPAQPPASTPISATPAPGWPTWKLALIGSIFAVGIGVTSYGAVLHFRQPRSV